MYFETNLTKRTHFDAQAEPHQGKLRRLVQVMLLLPTRMAKHRKTLKQFEGFLDLPDHLLNDIGPTRDQVKQDRLRYRLAGDLPHYFR